MIKRHVLILLTLSLISTAWAQKKKSFDEQLAQFAAELGTNRIATKGATDKKGKLLLRLAAAVDPKNKRLLLTQGTLDTGKKLRPVTTKMTEKKLLQGMLKRAEKLRTSGAVKDKTTGRRAFLYYCVVAEFQPDNTTAETGQIKLGKLGIKGTLKDLLPDVHVGGAQNAEEPEEEKPLEEEAPKTGPAKYANSTAPKEWKDFALARDKLLLKPQTELIVKKYTKVCPPVTYKAKSGLSIRGIPPEIWDASGTENEINSMQLGGGGSLNTLWPLYGVPLEYLDLQKVRGRELDFAPLALVRLKELRLERAEELTSLKNIGQLSHLTTLMINKVELFEDLRQLAGLKLQTLIIIDCPRLSKLDGLEKIPSLKTLVVQGSPKLRDLNTLRKLQLENVAFKECDGLRSIRPLEGAPLIRINLTDCSNLRERDTLNSLRKMPKLKEILGVDKAIVEKVLGK